MAKQNGKVYVNGEAIIKLLCEAGISSTQLANLLNLSPTTIANYEASSAHSPHLADTKKLQQIADHFRVTLKGLILAPASIESGKNGLEKEIRAAEQRFAGSENHCRSIAGTWHASSEDVPIPGELEYTHTIPWEASSEIIQVGNTFVARGVDKDEDIVLAEGLLLEGGNFVRFNYFLTHNRLRQYGTGLMEFLGDGQTMQGYFLGRDAGQCRTGIILAKIVFRLDKRTPQN